mgnify:CR=1 FL=1
MLAGSWKSAVLTIATDTQNSAAVDLGRGFENLQVIIPTIDSSVVNIKVADTLAGTYNLLNHTGINAAGHFLPGTTAGVGGITALFKLGGFQFIKVYCGTAQTANRTFTVRGMNPHSRANL